MKLKLDHEKLGNYAGDLERRLKDKEDEVSNGFNMMSLEMDSLMKDERDSLKVKLKETEDKSAKLSQRMSEMNSMMAEVKAHMKGKDMEILSLRNEIEGNSQIKDQLKMIESELKGSEQLRKSLENDQAILCKELKNSEYFRGILEKALKDMKVKYDSLSSVKVEIKDEPIGEGTKAYQYMTKRDDQIYDEFEEMEEYEEFQDLEDENTTTGLSEDVDNKKSLEVVDQDEGDQAMPGVLDESVGNKSTELLEAEGINEYTSELIKEDYEDQNTLEERAEQDKLEEQQGRSDEDKVNSLDSGFEEKELSNFEFPHVEHGVGDDEDNEMVYQGYCNSTSGVDQEDESYQTEDPSGPNYVYPEKRWLSNGQIFNSTSHLTCDQCNKVFKTERGVKVHRKRMHKSLLDKVAKSDTEQEEGADGDRANKDERKGERMTQGPEGYRCDQCEFVCKIEKSLKLHKTRKHKLFKGNQAGEKRAREYQTEDDLEKSHFAQTEKKKIKQSIESSKYLDEDMEEKVNQDGKEEDVGGEGVDDESLPLGGNVGEEERTVQEEVQGANKRKMDDAEEFYQEEDEEEYVEEENYDHERRGEEQVGANYVEEEQDDDQKLKEIDDDKPNVVKEYEEDVEDGQVEDEYLKETDDNKQHIVEEYVEEKDVEEEQVEGEELKKTDDDQQNVVEKHEQEEDIEEEQVEDEELKETVDNRQHIVEEYEEEDVEDEQIEDEELKETDDDQQHIVEGFEKEEDVEEEQDIYDEFDEKESNKQYIVEEEGTEEDVIDNDVDKDFEIKEVAEEEDINKEHIETEEDLNEFEEEENEEVGEVNKYDGFMAEGAIDIFSILNKYKSLPMSPMDTHGVQESDIENENVLNKKTKKEFSNIDKDDSEVDEETVAERTEDAALLMEEEDIYSDNNEEESEMEDQEESLMEKGEEEEENLDETEEEDEIQILDDNLDYILNKEADDDDLVITDIKKEYKEDDSYGEEDESEEKVGQIEDEIEDQGDAEDMGNTDEVEEAAEDTIDGEEGETENSEKENEEVETKVDDEITFKHQTYL